MGLPAIGAHPSIDQNKFERNARHNFGVFASCHHRELIGFDPECAPLIYCPVPVWFRRSFEVPFGFQPAGPEATVHCGSLLSGSPLSPLWKIVRAEHAANCAVELVYRARGHQERKPFGQSIMRRWEPRCYWLPNQVLKDIRRLGFANCVGNDRNAANQLEALVRENELIDWVNVWPSFRNLPMRNRGQSPVFESGDYVHFNPTEWESQMPASMYREEKADNNGKELRITLCGRSIRGRCLTGSFRNHPHQFSSRTG